jgi:diguanylate cyclase (GGDEF)-like protein
MRRLQKLQEHPDRASYIAGVSSRRGPIMWLVLSGCFLIGAIAVGTVMAASTFRDRAIQSEKRNLQNTVLLLSRHFDQRLDDFGDALRDALIEIHPLNGIDADVFKKMTSTLGVHNALRARASKSSDIAGINVFSADGDLINSSEAWPVSSLNVAEKKYFADLKSDSIITTRMEVIKEQFTDRWTIVVARRISDRDGKFLGIVSRGMDPYSIEFFFKSVALSPGSSIGLFHSDGTLLARYPFVDGMMGRSYENSPVHREILSKSPLGTIELTSPIDSLTRVAAAQRLDRFPASIIATTTTESALAEWRDQTKLLAIVATLVAFVIAITISLIVRQLARQHRIARQQLETALNNITQGLMLYDASSRVVLFNQRYIEMYGLSLSVIRPGRVFRDVMKHRKQTGSFEGDPEAFCDLVLKNVREKRLTHRILKTKDGRSIRMVNQPLQNGGWVTTHEDISELQSSEQRVAHLAHYDALTGLPNRTLFRERLETDIKQTSRGDQFALLYIDVDQFKEINDSLGHSVGDDFLKLLAERLKDCASKADFVARLGGDEFALIQTSIQDSTDVIELVTKIHASIREPFNCGGHQLSIDASIGIAMAPQDGSDIDQLIKHADLAMYEAKSSGRRTFRFFEPEMDEKAKAHREMAIDLREAIHHEAFEIHYQPVVDILSSEIRGCEALLRWNHPVKGAISPADFIPVAEDTGLISELGEWVLLNACKEAASWPKHIKLAVNVSPVQFKSQTLALAVVKALAVSGLSANRLELEITEAVLISNDEEALATLHQLRTLGVHIALDDFGIGYSSLSYLQRFPFDKIKIDRSFVKDLAGTNGSSSIVQAVVTIAAARSMVTTAEGVETKQQLDLLRSLGCTQMQGWLFSAAKPASEVRSLLWDIPLERASSGRA